MTRKFRLWDIFAATLGFAFTLWLTSFTAISQETSYREQIYSQKVDTITLDSLTIYPNSLKVICLGGSMVQLTRSDYDLDLTKNKLILFSKCGDSVKISYRVLPMNLRKVYGNRDTNQIYNPQKGDREKFLIVKLKNYPNAYFHICYICIS